MSHNKEEIVPLEDNKIGLKGPKVQLTPSKYVEKQSPKSSFVETQTKLISIGQQESLKLEVEGAPSHRATKLEKPAVSSNQGDSLDKDDGYLSSSRQKLAFLSIRAGILCYLITVNKLPVGV